jgi:hypothetical protein
MVDTHAGREENHRTKRWPWYSCDRTLSTALVILVCLFFQYRIDLIHARIDISGGLALDVRPHFPLPTDLIDLPHREPLSPTMTALIDNLISYSDTFVDTCDAFAALVSMSAIVNKRGIEESFFQRDQIYIKNFVTVVYQVLDLPQQDVSSGGPDDTNVLNETMRLAFILYIGLIKRRIGNPPDGVEKHRITLLRFLQSRSPNLSKFPALNLWILTVLAAAFDEDKREWQVDQIVDQMQTMGLWYWYDVERLVKSIAWIDKLLDHSSGLESLGAQVHGRQAGLERKTDS